MGFFRLVLFFAICLLTVTARSQSVATEYYHRFLGKKDGLGYQHVNCVSEDHRGMLWIGTERGLYRFDGASISPYLFHDLIDLSNQYIASLERGDLNDYIFVCTDNGAVILDPVTCRRLPAAKTGIPDSILNSCVQIKKYGVDSFILLTLHAIYRVVLKPVGTSEITLIAKLDIQGKDLPRLYCPSHRKDDIWIFLNTHNQYLVRSGQITQINIRADADIPTVQSDRLYPIFTREATYAVDWAQNIFALDQKAMTFKIRPDKHLSDLLPFFTIINTQFKIKPLLESYTPLDADQLAVCTNIGLFIFRKKWAKFKTPPELKGEEIRGIYTDSTGLFLVGTYSGTFERNRRGAPLKLNLKQKMAVWDYLPLGADKWAVCYEGKRGVRIWDRPKRAMTEVYADGFQLVMNRISIGASLCKDFKGDIWLGSDFLYRIPGSPPYTVKCFPDIHPPDFLSRQSAAAPFWVNTETETSESTEFALGTIRDLRLDPLDSSIWIGAMSGLYRMRYNRSTQQYENDPDNPYIREIPVSGLYLDNKNNLWVATKGKGIACLYNKRNPAVWYNRQQGLCDSMTCRIEGSNHDSIVWIGTHTGLARFETFSGIFHNFYEEDDLPNNEFNSAASAKASEHQLWFGTVTGLIEFDPYDFNIPSYCYKTFISNIKYYDAQQKAFCNSTPPDKGLTLEPYPEYLEFKIGFNDYVQPAKTRYRYRLIGLTDIWNTNTGNQDIVYLRLQPGRYVLEVQSTPIDGHFSAIIRYPIFIKTPFYETWCFLVLALFTLLGAVYGIDRYRLRQILKEQLIRRQIADDLHDDIGNKLNLLTILTRKIGLAIRKNCFIDTLAPLEQLGDISESTLTSLHTMIWTVDPSKDHLSDLISRMQDFTTDYLIPLNIKCYFQIPEVIPARELNLQVRHHLMLVFQELLTNMAKHAHPKSVTIQLQISTDGTLKLILENELHEKPLTTTTQGSSTLRGQYSIERRMTQIKGIFEWEERGAFQTALLTIPNIFKR